MSRRALPILVFVVALFLAGMAWVAGFVTGVVVHQPRTAVPAHVEPPPNFALYDEAWGVVNREFYGQRPAPESVTGDAVQGLVEALDDPYAAILAADEATGQDDPFHPHLVDTLGLWVEPVSGGANVLSVVPGSPAATATAPGEDEGETRPAVLPGDRILAANDVALAGMGLAKVKAALAGDAEEPAADSRASATAEPRDTTTLVLQRGDGPPFAVEIERAPVEVPNVVVTRPRPGVAVIALTHLDDPVLTEIDAVLSDLAQDPAEAIVLDLRDNPGGDLGVARQVAGRFMKGEVWREVTQDGELTPQKADLDGAPSFPAPQRLVVLVNAGTAAGAEMLAAALRDGAGATLVGEATLGKGTLQGLFPLADGSLLRLTTAHWQTLTGTDVDGIGLDPDQAVDGADAQLDAAVALALRSVTAGG